jgi:DNA polymerase-3 subunit delta
VDYATFLAAAGRGQLPPVSLLHGVDVQLLDDALAAASAGLFPEAGQAALGREVLDGRETSVAEILRAAATFPLVTALRLVAVRRAQALPAREADALGAYARDPNPTTCLLLLADEPLTATRERPREHWLLGAVPAAAVVALPAREGKDLADWLRQRAAAEGLEVSPEAARLLVAWVGDDAASLLGEARKAALTGGADGRKVGVTEVGAVVGEHRLAEVFELSRAVSRRDGAGALRTLDRLLATEEPMRLLALLVMDVRTAWSVADLSARGESVEAIARALRRPPRAVDAIARAGGSAPLAALARRLERCWEAEWRLKSGGEPRAELAALVADLCAAA